MAANSPEVSSPPRQHDRRRHERIFEAVKQLRLVVDDCILVTVDWSTGGCLVVAPPEMKVGDNVTGTLESPLGVLMGTITSEIIRIDDQGLAALRFTNYDSLL